MNVRATRAPPHAWLRHVSVIMRLDTAWSCPTMFNLPTGCTSVSPAAAAVQMHVRHPQFLELAACNVRSPQSRLSKRASVPNVGRAEQEHGLATVGGARQFYSVHGGTAFTGGAEPLEGSRSSRGRLSSLKPSSTAVNLSDMMPPNLSVHNGGPGYARTALSAQSSALLRLFRFPRQRARQARMHGSPAFGGVAWHASIRRQCCT
jgi:hypothetical protein